MTDQTTPNTGHLIGYARVSTTGQSLDVQLDALRAHGVDETNTYSESLSGQNEDRPELAAAIKSVRKGDTLVVTRIDRLARSTFHLCNIARQLDEKGAFLKVLGQPIDTTNANGRLQFNILAAIAEFETELRAERQAEGIARAKQKGVKFGRKAVPDRKIKRVLELHEQGVRVKEIMEEVDLGRTTVYRLIKTHQRNSELARRDFAKTADQ